MMKSYGTVDLECGLFCGEKCLVSHGMSYLIYYILRSLCVCVCVCQSGYSVFRYALRYGAETWLEGRECPPPPETQGHIFKATQPKVIQRSSWFWNVLWPPNLVTKNTEGSVMHFWGQRSWGKLGSTRGQIAQKCPILVGRTLDQSVVHWWGQRSYRGQPRLRRGQIAQECPMATRFGRKNSWPKRNALLGSKVM